MEREHTSQTFSESSEHRTIAARIRRAATRLRDAGLGPRDAVFDAELLARSVLGWGRAELLTRAEEPTSEDFTARYEALIARRERREPAAQVLGQREFWGRDFAVTRDVLVPRPESELIVETALELHAASIPRRLVDVGTGSGCLAVSLALEWPAVQVLATDVSEKALRVAARNAVRHGVADQIQFVRTDLLTGLAPGLELVVANPPYVRSSDRPALSPEVRDYEPAEALFGGADGLDIVRALLDQASRALKCGGRLVMEFGAGQDDDVTALVTRCPALELETIRCDLQAIPRVAVVARRF
jgi:release factor glutamine methyltransferase